MGTLDGIGLMNNQDEIKVFTSLSSTLNEYTVSFFINLGTDNYNN